MSVRRRLLGNGCAMLAALALGSSLHINAQEPPPTPPAGAPIINSIGMKLAYIPVGDFVMGSPESEEGEYPHRVRITRPFYLGVYEVTQSEYERVMGVNPSWFSKIGKGAFRVSEQDTSCFPVESVSWEDAAEFCRRLSALPEEERAGRKYRLPTEAEWEYACRAGTTTPFHFGSQLNGREANCDGRMPYGTESPGSYLDRTTTVGLYAVNGFGLYDMHGNVWEWCEDWLDWKYYKRSPVDNPVNTQEEKAWHRRRVLRGGSWHDFPEGCRAAARDGILPSNRYGDVGFRVAHVPPGR